MAFNYSRNKNLKFINPYTFVPTPKPTPEKPYVRSSAEKIYSEDLHTGVLRCRLHVRTPLGIPDTERTQGTERHKKYPFFSYRENGDWVPVIPGSSLRGTVRSVFEAATDSCFSTLRNNTGLSRRVGNREAYRPGVLKWTAGTWKLYEAKRYLLAVDPAPAVRLEKGEIVNRNYTRFAGLPEDTYVNILQKGKEGPRFARTGNREGQGEEDLYFGDEVEFRADNKGRYEKGRFLIWEGAACGIRKRRTDGKHDSSGKTGLVYIGETFSRKKHGESIFVPGREVPGLDGERLKKAYRGLLETLEVYRNPAVNRDGERRGHSGYRGFEHADRERGIPVWYSVQKKDSSRNVKLSMASIGRILYDNTLNDLVGERNSCTNRKELCEACALFGMSGAESLGSRIRFTDARAKEGYELKEETLQILGQPRYSYLPFYAKEQGKATDSYDGPDVEIAGRKFYWHNEKAATDPGVYGGAKPNQMNDTLELVMPGTEFAFGVYYDGITEKQLGKLMWCLNFGENREDGALCHKLGHGKPLGLGSVKLVIEERAERIFKDGVYEWRHEKITETESEPPEIKNREALEKVADFYWLRSSPNKDLRIMYPDVYDEQGREFPEERSNDEARHIWYRMNREKPYPGNDYDPVETLPDILVPDQALHGYQKKGGNRH